VRSHFPLILELLKELIAFLIQANEPSSQKYILLNIQTLISLPVQFHKVFSLMNKYVEEEMKVNEEKKKLNEKDFQRRTDYYEEEIKIKQEKKDNYEKLEKELYKKEMEKVNKKM